jgi:hypothetical protein
VDKIRVSLVYILCWLHWASLGWFQSSGRAEFECFNRVSGETGMGNGESSPSPPAPTGIKIFPFPSPRG